MMRHSFRLLYLALSILVQHAGEIRDAFKSDDSKSDDLESTGWLFDAVLPAGMSNALGAHPRIFFLI